MDTMSNAQNRQITPEAVSDRILAQVIFRLHDSRAHTRFALARTSPFSNACDPLDPRAIRACVKGTFIMAAAAIVQADTASVKAVAVRAYDRANEYAVRKTGLELSWINDSRGRTAVLKILQGHEQEREHERTRAAIAA